MHPTDLVRQLTSMAAAADLVEAFANPDVQAEHGWCLQGWTFEPVPWGVRFLYHDRRNVVASAVVALALPESRRASLAMGDSAWPTTVLLLG